MIKTLKRFCKIIFSPILGILQSVYHSLLRMNMQMKLFVSSFLIYVIITVIVFTILNTYVSQLVIQQQAAFNEYSFDSVKRQLKSVHEEIEIYFKEINKNHTIIEALENGFTKSNIIEINSRINTIDNEINSIFVRKDFIESIILIGQNDFSYGYLKGGLSQFFGENQDFVQMYNDINSRIDLKKRKAFPFIREQSIWIA